MNSHAHHDSAICRLARHIIIPAVLFYICSAFSSPAAEARIVRVGVYENNPKVFTDESGKPAGVFIDIIEYIADKESWDLRYKPGTWAEGLSRLEKGDIDLMPDVAYTSERDEIFSFHKVPVLSSWFQVYARKGSGIKTILDLNNKSAVVLERSVQEEAFIHLSEGFGLAVKLVSVPDYDHMFEIVAGGRADAAITNRFYGLMHAKEYGLEDTAIVFNPSNLFFAAPENAPGDLLNTIDSYLADLKKDTQSVYYKSMKRWTSEDVAFQFPVWARVLALVAGIALVMTAAGSVVLKHQVNVRTAELNEAMQRFSDIVEFLPDATFVIDQNKKIMAWNQACEVLTGIKQEALMGKGDYAYAEALIGEHRPVLIDLLDTPAPETEAEYRYIQRAGSRIFAEFFIPRLRNGAGAYLWGVASPLFDKEGRRCGAIESIRDITEQKQVEEALRVSEKKYRELVMLASTIILHWSADGTIIFMNEFGLKFFGYSEGELLGRQVVGTIVPENESTGRDLQEMINDIAANPYKYERNINENICSDGRRVWIDWANKVVEDEKGRFKEMVSIGTDITKRVMDEEQIRRLNEELKRYSGELEQRVEERTAELASAMEKAQAADRIKSAFLATMSHELRTPLNSIIGFTGILLQGLAGALNEEQNKQMVMVQKSSRHLLSLINDVLDISKIEAGQMELAAAPFDLKQSVEKTVNIVKPMAEKKGLNLKADIRENTGIINSDQRRVEQIILNLLNNAVKFTEKGEVKISCNIENGECVLIVSDTGMGISPEEIPGLFQPFHQIDTGTSRRIEGTGLGLSICKKILDMMNGTIGVQSTPGEGSTFTVRFPAGAGEAV